MDNQIRIIIALLKESGGTMTYGVMFEMTQDKFDALSAILHTAKKRGVVEFEGVMLMQGKDDGVVIKLLKDTIEDTPVFHSVRLDAPIKPQSSMGPESCYMCSKTVYPTERIAPNQKVMHKTCFKCKTCNSTLSLNSYCLNNGIFYWYNLCFLTFFFSKILIIFYK